MTKAKQLELIEATQAKATLNEKFISSATSDGDTSAAIYFTCHSINAYVAALLELKRLEIEAE